MEKYTSIFLNFHNFVKTAYFTRYVHSGSCKEAEFDYTIPGTAIIASAIAKCAGVTPTL